MHINTTMYKNIRRKNSNFRRIFAVIKLPYVVVAYDPFRFYLCRNAGIRKPQVPLCTLFFNPAVNNVLSAECLEYCENENFCVKQQ